MKSNKTLTKCEQSEENSPNDDSLDDESFKGIRKNSQIPFHHYIRKAYKSVNPKIELEDEIFLIFQDFLKDFFKRIVNESKTFSEIAGRRVIKTNDIKAALNIILPLQISQNLKKSLK